MENLPPIIVAEDDPDIQELVEDALTAGGFQCAVVASAEEAITLLQARAAEYQALVMDISLRGSMSGWDAARRARELVADLAIIYMTAGAGDQWPAQGVPNSILLQKPFAPAQLVTAVSHLLNKGTPTSP